MFNHTLIPFNMSNERNPIEWLVQTINEDCLNSTFVRPEVYKEAMLMYEQALANSCLKGYRDASDEIKKVFNLIIKPKDEQPIE